MVTSSSRKYTSSNSLCYGLIVLLHLVLQAECFRWVKNVYDGNVFGNRSEPALFRWKYVLDGADQASLNIKCGYLYTSNIGVTETKYVAHKRGHNSRITVSGQLPGSSNQQLEAYQELLPGGGVDRSVVGFKILYAQLTHPRMYRCVGVYQIGKSDLNDLRSEVKNLVVLDPPVLIDCLDNLQQVKVKEKEDLEFSCSVKGNPPPTLQCSLLNWMDVPIVKYPEPASTNNITRHLFKKIDREAERIMCYADGGIHTGHTNITIDLNVHHSPHAPELVMPVPATNHSCIRVQWSIIPRNETGGDISKYKILYYETSQGRFSHIGIDLPAEDLKPVDEFYTHEICGLKPHSDYTVEVAAINVNGIGIFEIFNVVPDSIAVEELAGDDASVGVIIGGIIAGIVFIVIFVVLAVWCSTRSKKHERFPTSHVEDAVDYPSSGMGHSLYANVDKNKNKAPSHAGSAADYPDVVHDTSEVRPMVSSNSYETSNKAFV